MIEIVIQLMILGTLWGILVALKHGFNQVIRGLEALDRNTVDPGGSR